MPGWAQWLLAPIHALALASGAKSFEANPVLGSATLNRYGLHIARKRLALRLGARRRASLADALTPEERAAFDRDGFLVIPNLLPPADFEALRAEILGHRTAAREFADGSTLTRLIPLDARALRDLPAARAALLGARYQGLHAYAGSFRSAPHLFIQTVFSGVRDAPVDVQSHWHSDTFHPTVKSWLFLTDVGEDEAGFTYVPGSHRPTRRHLAWERRISVGAATSPDRMTREGSLRIEEVVLARLGYPPPRKLAVAPNTLVIADTSGLHRRGHATGAACRIAIWAYGRGSPFWPWPGGLPPLPGRGHAVRAFWALQDMARRLTRRRGGWRWVGERTPAMPPPG
ncbi:phytanoyl-CoA dioxygenase family protein [Paracraurococcus lichenis]|uniref:Phytanoyl-CoA dioxygenase family protein n=1 Tax=Paracraurococcus lichenis TaxID=3064888 RepID=A0ABT9DX41_9PROT|nr:phytanoyl-CoA dioxygenase family protein [Paracraurococcus sp. LOR1-02]MDO9708464.1 phytanoyl-CoA dioxygenase family protein [Paracraurococcus sp. LOR1-02]